jgi:hypothetical protein
MLGGHICMAGIDVDTGKRVRPVTSTQLSGRLLASRGGPVGLGRVLDLGRTAPRRSPPEVEDTRFALPALRHLQTLDADAFLARLHGATSDLADIGRDLQRRGRNLVVPAGKGRCSLVAVHFEEPVRVFINEECRLRLAWHDGLSLPVTDIRLYTADFRAPDPAAVRALADRLAVERGTYLCFGLGRPYEGYHWLQLNNLHLSSDPAWSLQ